METIFQENQIVFISSLIPAYAVIGIGFLFLLIGLLFFRKVYKKIRLFWIMFGLSLIALGVMDIKVGAKERIMLDKDQKALVILERKYFGEEVKTLIPFDNFSHLEIIRDWSIRQGNLLSTSDLDLTINLVRWGNKPIELGTYNEKEFLKELVNKLRTTVSFPVLLIGNAQDKPFSNFSREFLNADNVEILYRVEEISTFLPLADTVETTPIKYELPHPINIEIVQEGSDTMAVWNNMHHVFWIILVGIVTFAGMFLMHNWLLPKQGFGAGFAISYAFLVIVSLVWIGFVLSGVFGQNKIEFKDSNITYSTNLFGITAFEQVTPKGDIFIDYPIINSINPNHDVITIVSVQGYLLLSQSVSEYIEVVNEEFKKAQKSPMQYRILIDINGLSTGERLFLEEELRKQLLEVAF